MLEHFPDEKFVLKVFSTLVSPFLTVIYHKKTIIARVKAVQNTRKQLMKNAEIRQSAAYPIDKEGKEMI